MKNLFLSFACRTIEDQSGQVLVISAAVLAALLVLGGLGMDAGRGYIAQARLQTYANAAALAAAGEVYNSSTENNATTYANNYSGSSGDENAVSYLGTITTGVVTKCLNVLMPSGTTCVTGSNPNAVRVTESASIPTTFMALLGKKTMNISAIATAAMQGIAQKWNIAVIEDATGSMADTDSNCGGISQYQCALDGIQDLLAATNPCAPGAASCTPAAASLRVALFTFPNIMTQYLPAFNACESMSFTGQAVPYNVYTLPIPGATSYTPLEYQEANDSYTWSASYEVTYGASDADTNGFVSDFYAPNNTSTGGLNATSSIVQAVGYGGTGSSSKTGCMTISPSGIALNGIVGTPTGTSKVNTADVGEGITYYASPLYAAQAALTAESTAHPGSQNAIIILGDGAMNTQWIYFPQGSMWQWPTTNSAEPSTDVSGYSEYDTLKTTPNKNALVASSLSSPTQEASGTISGVYPDFLDECQQAIVAAQYATNHGTRVFSVAYGAAASGCTSGTHADDFTDVTLVTLPSTPNASFTLSTLTPCVTMENLASTLQDFYSDYLQSGGGVDGNCIDNSHSVTALSDIFQSIASTFSTPRLIPNDAT